MRANGSASQRADMCEVSWGLFLLTSSFRSLLLFFIAGVNRLAGEVISEIVKVTVGEAVITVLGKLLKTCSKLSY